MDKDFLASAYPYPGYNFRVVLDGYSLGFKSVSGLTLRNENYSAFHEGGENLTVAVHRGEKSELNHLTLKKGLGFFNPSKLMSKINVMILMVFDEGKKLSHAYVFSPGYVESVSVSDFDAQDNALLIDTTVIAYDFAVEVDMTGRTTPDAFKRFLRQRLEEQTAAETAAADTIRRIKEHNARARLLKKEKQAASPASPIEY